MFEQNFKKLKAFDNCLLTKSKDGSIISRTPPTNFKSNIDSYFFV